MVSNEEAFLIFRKWAEELIPLLFRSHSPLYTHSILCGMDSVKEDAIRLRMQGLGHVDVRLAPYTFEYFDPAAHRTPPGEPEPDHSMDSLTIGAGIIATTPTGESFLLVEIHFT